MKRDNILNILHYSKVELKFTCLMIWFEFRIIYSKVLVSGRFSTLEQPKWSTPFSDPEGLGQILSAVD